MAGRKRNDPLGILYNFSHDELEANRQGSLSPMQRQTLEKATRRETTGSLLYAVGAPLILAALFCNFMVLGGAIRKDPSLTAVVIITLLLTSVVVGGASIGNIRRVIVMKRGQLRQTVGPAQIKTIPGAGMRGSHHGTTARFKVGNITFFLPNDAVPYIQEGQTYRVYYVITTVFPLILSLEIDPQP